MEEVLDVFRVVKGSGVACGFGSFFDIPWFTGINPFENAESPEIWKSYLQFPHSLGSSDVVFCLTSRSFLLYFAHCEYWRGVQFLAEGLRIN